MKQLFVIFFISLNISSVNAGIYEPNVTWSKAKINVCFYDSHEQLSRTEFKNGYAKKKGFTPAFLSKDETIAIRDNLRKNFTAEDTGIHFTGWEKCSKTKKIDVIVMRADPIKRKFWFDKDVPFGGTANIGQADQSGSYFEKDYDLIPVVAIVKFSPFVISHEFGHIAGLRHEHIHPDASRDDETCKYEIFRGPGSPPDYGDRRTSEKPHDTTRILTEYDSNSIMNYCALNIRDYERKGRLFNKVKHREGSLTELDKETLRFIYSDLPAEDSPR